MEFTPPPDPWAFGSDSGVLESNTAPDVATDLSPSATSEWFPWSLPPYEDVFGDAWQPNAEGNDSFWNGANYTNLFTNQWPANNFDMSLEAFSNLSMAPQAPLTTPYHSPQTPLTPPYNSPQAPLTPSCHSMQGMELCAHANLGEGFGTLSDANASCNYPAASATNLMSPFSTTYPTNVQSDDASLANLIEFVEERRLDRADSCQPLDLGVSIFQASACSTTPTSTPNFQVDHPTQLSWLSSSPPLASPEHYSYCTSSLTPEIQAPSSPLQQEDYSSWARSNDDSRVGDMGGGEVHDRLANCSTNTNASQSEDDLVSRQIMSELQQNASRPRQFVLPTDPAEHTFDSSPPVVETNASTALPPVATPPNQFQKAPTPLFTKSTGKAGLQVLNRRYADKLLARNSHDLFHDYDDASMLQQFPLIRSRKPLQRTKNALALPSPVSEENALDPSTTGQVAKYKIEKVLDRRFILADDGFEHFQYYVKWAGANAPNNSWVASGDVAVELRKKFDVESAGKDFEGRRTVERVYISPRTDLLKAMNRAADPYIRIGSPALGEPDRDRVELEKQQAAEQTAGDDVDMVDATDAEAAHSPPADRIVVRKHAKQQKKLLSPKPLTYKGTFRQEERDIIQERAGLICRTRNITMSQFKDYVQTRNYRQKRDVREVWDSLMAALPLRDKVSVQKYCRREFNNAQRGSDWTPEQDAELLHFVTEYKKEYGQSARVAYAQIAEVLSRRSEDCRDRYRDVLEFPDRRTDAWTQEEEEKLDKIVEQVIQLDMDELDQRGQDMSVASREDWVARINWDVVAKLMKTRNRLQCHPHWVAMKKGTSPRQRAENPNSPRNRNRRLPSEDRSSPELPSEPYQVTVRHVGRKSSLEL